MTRSSSARPARSAIPGTACRSASSCSATPTPITRSRPARWCPTTTGAHAGLTPDGAPEGFLNLGLNGSYMVVRELRQYVGRVLEIARGRRRAESAPTIRARRMSPPTGWPNASSVATSTGICSARAARLAADRYGQPQNDFGFMRERPLRPRLPARLACAPRQSARRARQGRGLGADAARRGQQPPDPAARPQVRPAAERPLPRTTTRSAACSSSA